MSKVIIQNFSKSYRNSLIEFLKQAGFTVISLNSDEIINYFRSTCDENAIDVVDTTVIITSEDCAVLHTVNQIMQRLYVNRRPKVVLLSTLLTWSGGKYDQRPINTTITDFYARVPAVCVSEEYFLENFFLEVVRTTGLNGFIVGVGLVYGHSGFDMEEIFRSLWYSNGTKSTAVVSLTDGRGTVPMVHFHDFTRLLLHIINQRNVWPVRYIAATDNNSTNLRMVFDTVAKNTKTNIHFTTPAEGMEVLLASPEQMLWASDFPVFSQETYNMIDFTLSYPQGITTMFPQIWSEFLAFHHLQPCAVVIAGPPRTHKTALAQSISKRLDIPFVDVASSLRYVLFAPLDNESSGSQPASTNQGVEGDNHHPAPTQSSHGDRKATGTAGTTGAGGSRANTTSRGKSAAMESRDKERDKGKDESNPPPPTTATTEDPPNSSSNQKRNSTPGDNGGYSPPYNSPDPTKALPTELLRTARGRLEKAIDSQSTGKGRGGRHKGEDFSEFKLHLTFSDSFCRTIPAQLVRMCIAAVVKSDLNSIRRGYVLDAWDWAVQGAADLRQIAAERDEPTPGLDSSSVSSGMSGSRPSTSNQNMKYQMPGLLLEIQTPDAIVVNRVLCELLNLPVGSTLPLKIPKEHQPVVKELDSRQSTYNSLLLPLPGAATVPPATETIVPPSRSGTAANQNQNPAVNHSKMSHKGVQELESEGIVSVSRFDTSSDSMDNITDFAQDFYRTKNGDIGWLAERNLNTPNGGGAGSGGGMSSDKLFSDIVIDQRSQSRSKRPGDSRDSLRRGMDVDNPQTAESGVRSSTESNGPKPTKGIGNTRTIQENLSGLDPRDQQTVIDHCAEYQEYLVANVLPHIAEGLIQITQGKPVDPIGYLVDFLRNRGSQLEQEANADALKKFMNALSLAEQLDRDPMA